MEEVKTAGMEREGEQAETVDSISALEQESGRLLQSVEKTAGEMEAYYAWIVNQAETAPGGAGVEEQVTALKNTARSLGKAYLRVSEIGDELDARWHDLRKSRRKRKLLPAAPANAVIDLTEDGSRHFARGLNLYKLLWICFIGSFAGVVVETLWCLVTNRYLESRAGLVYGPFNLLYGAGAVALTLCLYRYRNRGGWLSFLGGMVVGSVIEYVCSWGQELVFGSRSWDYSHMPFNINGRICLLYSAFWGILGVLWIKDLYPRMAKWVLKIPNKTGKIITWVLTAFFVLNAAMSMVSLYRWTQRLDGVAPSNGFWAVIDERFPDERMERIYANMEFME